MLLAVAAIVGLVLVSCALGSGSPVSRSVRRRRSGRGGQPTAAAGRVVKSQRQPLLQLARVRRRGAGAF